NKLLGAAETRSEGKKGTIEARTNATATKQRAERSTLLRVVTPGGNQIVASAAKPAITAAMPRASPIHSSPCSKRRNGCVNDRSAIHSTRPGGPATVKSSTHDPMVNASVTMAAVAALSDTAAANKAIAPTSEP